jgi:hypothetical protein
MGDCILEFLSFGSDLNIGTIRLVQKFVQRIRVVIGPLDGAAYFVPGLTAVAAFAARNVLLV